MTDSALEFRRQAEAALRSGRNDEAVVAYRDYLRLVPDDADAWFNLGYLLRAGRRFDSAVAAYRQAIALGVDRPEEARLNLAVILSDHCNDGAGAAAELEQAVATNSLFLPAWLNLGNLREDLGDARGAADAYRQALAVDPGCGRAHGRLAMIDCHQGGAADAAEMLERLLREHIVTRPHDQAEVFYALGHALDGCGRFDRAFHAIDRANRLRGNAVQYDRVATERMVDAIIAGGSNQLRSPQSDSLEPVFVCGLFRSGSTLAELLIERRFGLAAGGELETLPALALQLGLPQRRSLGDLSQAELQSGRDHYASDVGRIHPEGGGLIDKRCDNFLQIGLIKAILPNARIIHTRRDLRDTVLSLWFGNFDDSMAYTFSLEASAHWVGQYRRLMRHWENLFGGDIFALDYERLVGEPEVVIGELGQFLGQPVLPDQQVQPARAVKTLSSWQVRQPLHQRSVQRWLNYSRQLEPVMRMLEPT